MSDFRFIRALYRQPVDKTPVWLMRQAGRYLPEYRQLREKAGDFLTACKTPELACEITLQPLRRFALDAAIIFSDILTVPDAMGLGLYFAKDHGPRFHKTLQTAADIAQLRVPDPERELRYVTDAIRLVKKELNHRLPLIGFAGSPWTLAAYMLEGGKSENNNQFPRARAMLYQSPALMHQLLHTLAQATVAYLNAQIAAGVDAVMIFDTWGGLLSGPHYQAFSLYYMQMIISQLTKQRQHQKIPCIVFTKNGGQWLENMVTSGCDAIGIDWTTDIAQARKRVGHQVALQGNLDPTILYTDPDTIRTEVQRILNDFGPHPGHVFNLGHGIPKDVSVENIAAVVDAVHNFIRVPAYD